MNSEEISRKIVDTFKNDGIWLRHFITAHSLDWKGLCETESPVNHVLSFLYAFKIFLMTSSLFIGKTHPYFYSL
jgi:hypothetical protein